MPQISDDRLVNTVNRQDMGISQTATNLKASRKGITIYKISSNHPEKELVIPFLDDSTRFCINKSRYYVQ